MGPYIFLIVLTIIICILLAVVVLIQNPKGGGLDASFGGVSNNTFGAQRTTNFLEKATWGLAVALVVLSIGSAMYIHNWKGDNTAREILKSTPEMNQPAPANQEGINIGDFTSPNEETTPEN